MGTIAENDTETGVQVERSNTSDAIDGAFAAAALTEGAMVWPEAALAVMAAASVAGVIEAEAMGDRDTLVVTAAAATAMRRVMGLPI